MFNYKTKKLRYKPYSIMIPQKMSSMSDCIDELLKTQDVICLMDNFRGDYYIKKHLDEKGVSPLNIVDADFYGDYICFPSENGSPFLEEIENLMGKIVEADLNTYWENKHRKSEFTDISLVFRKLKDQHTLQRFVIVLVLGYVISTLTFFSEILINKYLKN